MYPAASTHQMLTRCFDIFPAENDGECSPPTPKMENADYYANHLQKSCCVFIMNFKKDEVAADKGDCFIWYKTMGTANDGI